MTGFHAEGRQLMHREVADGRPWVSYPVRVVAHSEAEFVTYVARGTPMTFGPADGLWGTHPWQALGDRWLSRGVLRIHPCGSGHVVEARWTDEGPLACWYVNFQAPLRHGSDGYETLDHEMDLVVEPDLGGLQVKDASDFVHRVRSGGLDAATAAGVIEEAGTLIERIGRADAWWNREWAQWRPPADWEEWI